MIPASGEGAPRMPASDTFRIWFDATLLMGFTSGGQALRAQEKQSAIPGGYRIVPGDVLQIDVSRRPEVTRTIPVMPAGTILLPLLGNVKASGLMAMQPASSVKNSKAKSPIRKSPSRSARSTARTSYQFHSFRQSLCCLTCMSFALPSPEALPASRVAREG
jgi:protein involved in polysaccharide export with SLBB domain